MTYVIIALVAVVIAAVAVVNVRRYRALKSDGVEADAVVSRVVKHDEDPDTDDVSYVYYVTYQARNGETVEARLGAVPKLGKQTARREGDKLRIRYLPDKPKYVLPAE